MGKSQKTSNRLAVGYRLAVGMNGKAGDLGAAAPRGFSLRKPRRKAPGSFTFTTKDTKSTKEEKLGVLRASFVVKNTST
jgi:hypothetical protein